MTGNRAVSVTPQDLGQSGIFVAICTSVQTVCVNRCRCFCDRTSFICMKFCLGGGGFSGMCCKNITLLIVVSTQINPVHLK